MVRAVLFALLCWAASLASASAAGGRVALVIGNGTYLNVSPLTNPLNDAADLAAALESAGFAVTRASDLDYAAMRATLQEFGRTARGADIAMIFYAGHGMEIDNRNYLVPVDASLETDSDVLYDTIPLELLTEAVSKAKTLSLVILDACRNNPFRIAGSSRSLGRGLSFVEPAAGTLVAFAARDGTIAADGEERNSPFTRALLRYVTEPGLDVNLMFRKVRDDVMADTGNTQEPFVYGSLPGRAIYLVPPVDVASTENLLPGAKTEQEEFAWSLVKDTTDVTRITDFIDAFPRGVHAAEAIDKLRELAGPVVSDIVIEPLQPDVATLTVPVPETLPAGTQTPRGDVATLTPLTEPLPLPTPVFDERLVALQIQTELNRIGCNVGTPDGIWGRRSEAGLALFAKQTSRDPATLLLEPPLLNLLKTTTGQICPVVCSVRENLVGNQCVLKSCPSGQRLSSKGICYVPVAATPRKEVVEEPPKKKKLAPPTEVTPNLCSLCN